jgi:predicted lipid carrier protein YhbT
MEQNMNVTSSAAPTGWPVPAAMRRLVASLPLQPPSAVLAAVLNRVLRPRLPADAAQLLADRVVEIEVQDLGVRCRLMLARGRFRAAGSGPVTLRIAAPATSYLRLLRGEDDADRLFFERALVMEGDTEYGLVLKNTLDAIGSLVRWP